MKLNAKLMRMNDQPAHEGTTLALCGLLFLMVVPVGGSASAQDLPTLADSLEIPVSTALQRALTGRINSNQSVRYGLAAGRSGNTAYAQPLKRIATRYTEDPELPRRVALGALHGLLLLDTPKAYFFENIRQYEQNKWLAYFSMYVIASRPDEEVLKLAEELLAEVRDGNLDSAALSARSTYYIVAQYDTMTSVQKQAQFLVKHAGAGVGSKRSVEDFLNMSDYFGGPMSPLAMWAKQELPAFSRRHPSVVAREIAEKSAERSAGAAQRYRAYLRDYLSAPARAALKGVQE